jgi:hypothetical protein
MSAGHVEVTWWKRLIVNRFVLVPAALAAAIALWNVYVSLHDHGIVAGRVVDTGGRPVADAYVEKTRVKTDPAGHFIITNNDSHNIRLAAEKVGVGRSERVPVRLYFRAEDIELRDPLILSGSS